MARTVLMADVSGGRYGMTEVRLDGWLYDGLGRRETTVDAARQ